LLPEKGKSLGDSERITKKLNKRRGKNHKDFQTLFIFDFHWFMFTPEEVVKCEVPALCVELTGMCHFFDMYEKELINCLGLTHQ
jgi:hypothetical protein